MLLGTLVRIAAVCVPTLDLDYNLCDFSLDEQRRRNFTCLRVILDFEV